MEWKLLMVEGMFASTKHLCLCALLVTGCMTRNTVSSNAVAPLPSQAYQRGTKELIVSGEFGSRARIDPNSNLRFSDGKGRFSPLLDAEDLRSDGKSLYAPHRMPFDLVSTIEGAGLNEEEVLLLRFTRPSECKLSTPPGGPALMQGPDKLVRMWLVEFLDKREAELRTRGCLAEAGTATNRGLIGCRSGAVALGGRWTMIHGAGQSEAIATAGLRELVDKGVPVYAGWDLESIREVEVHHLSGARTLLGMLAIPTFFSGGAHVASDLAKKGLEDERRYLRPTIFAARESVQPVFSDSFLRRSAIEGTLQLRTQLGHKGSMITSDVSVGARFFQVFDLKLGFSHAMKRDYRRLGASLPGPKSSTSYTPLHGYYLTGGLGISAPLDAAKKFTIPVGVDLGAGSGFFARFSAGLRHRVNSDLQVGVYVLNPTRVSFPETANPGSESYWTYQSGMDLEYAF
ncbi:MAG: hypothetical protein GY811_23765 [Myxococcales bacterium]|nr:hypothetical protein [Myxococcales bacterium]